LNRLFAFFNFGNGLWNLSDGVLLFPEPGKWEWLLRITGVGGCVFITFVLHFAYELIEIADKKPYRQILISSYLFAAAFIVLHQTPLLNTSVIGSVDVPPIPMLVDSGPLFPLFAGFLVLSMGAIMWPIIGVVRKGSGLIKKQASYMLMVAIIGIIPIGFFILSIYGDNYSHIYYPFQMLVSFIFAYAIFKHNLVPARVGFRRGMLLLGIYAGIGILLIPIVKIYFFDFLKGESGGYQSFWIFLFVIGILFSLGPLVYARLVRVSTLFREESSAHLAHEFKSPLHAIQSAREIIADEVKRSKPDKARIAEYMDMIQRNSERLEKYVGDILHYTQFEGAFDTAEKEAVDLGALIADVVYQFPNEKPRIRSQGERSVILKANMEGMRQIFRNLISNAVKNTSRGNITIQLKKSSNSIEASVQDEGPGIAPADLARVFEPYVKLGNEGGQKKGSGLGLAIVKKWVQYHNGQVWAESEGPGKGSKFIFVLPC